MYIEGGLVPASPYALMFERVNGIWQQTDQQFIDQDGQAIGIKAIALKGSDLFVGGTSLESDVSEGVVHHFKRSDEGEWVIQNRLRGPTTERNYFARSIAIWEGGLLVGHSSRPRVITFSNYEDALCYYTSGTCVFVEGFVGDLCQE